MLEQLSDIKQSYSVAFADYVRSLEMDGRNIIKMQTGDPDFKTHNEVISSAVNAINSGETKYCDSKGLLSLRKAISNKLLSQNSIKANPFENILVTHGAVHAISIAIRSILNNGDECIIIEPYWRCYEASIILSGAKPIIVEANFDSGFGLNVQKVLKKITAKTKLIIINTPNNPSGSVYSRDELSLLAKEASKKNIYILSDEVYESLIYDDNKHYSMASDSSVSDWIISIFSFSKTFAMTGWRIGYLVASKFIVEELIKVSQFSITSLSPYNQIAATTALQSKVVEDYCKIMINEYMGRRNFIINKIKNTWLEEAITIPEGAFYILIDLRNFKISSLEIAKIIVNKFGVSFTPGIAFGDNMDGHLRMCYATSNQNIEIALSSLLNLKSIL